MLLIEVTDTNGTQWRVNLAHIVAVRPFGAAHCLLHLPGTVIQLDESADSLCEAIGAVERDAAIE